MESAKTDGGEWYYEILKDKDVTTYHESKDNEAVHHLFVITLKNRDQMIEKLSKAGVPTGIHYPVPIHKHECFAELDFARGKVSQTLKNNLQNCFLCQCTLI